MKKMAIALRYPNNVQAPFIIAKGFNKQADFILKLAQEHKVPVVTENETATLLSLKNIGDCIPEETYEVLAGVFAFLKKVTDYDKH